MWGLVFHLCISLYAITDSTFSTLQTNEVENDRIYKHHSDHYCTEPPTRGECNQPDATKSNPRCAGVTISHSDDPSNMGSRYYVYREPGAGRYSVDVPILFDFRGIPGDKRELARQRVADVNQCLTDHRNLLTDGRRHIQLKVIDAFDSGERTIDEISTDYEKLVTDYSQGLITLQIYQARQQTLLDELLPRTDRNEVTIHNNYDRANSANWPDDISCLTINHEVLHLAGLCDHYKERWMKYESEPIQLTELLQLDFGEFPRYDCRPNYDGPNLMKNQRVFDSTRQTPADLARYRQLVQAGPPAADDRYSISSIECLCPASMNTGDCEAALNKAQQPGESSNGYLNCSDAGLDIHWPNYNPEIRRSGDSVYNIINRSQNRITIEFQGKDHLRAYEDAKDTLQAIANPIGLDPKQIDAVLHPLCMSNPSSRAYYETAVNAYRNRYQGQGCFE